MANCSKKAFGKTMIPFWDGRTLLFYDLEPDHWKYLPHSKPRQVVFRNHSKLMLVAYPEKEQSCQAKFEHRLIGHGDRVKFLLHYYKDTNPKSGLSIVFQVEVNRKPYLLYATDRTVGFKEGEPPKNISGIKSEYVFYQQLFKDGIPNAFKFESSLHEGLFLAFNENDNLYLKKVEQSDIDETSRINAEWMN
ncbi:interleukin-18-like isoform X1 [Pleurodeles waltl]|uniref:interleukin-18-like isoform X1 n=1 Tax=Pleurodeles waltl TaxID=8319 RepID=UPI0037095EB0